MIDILIIGSGGREHAIAKKLQYCGNIWYYGPHRNPGMDRSAKLANIGSTTNVDLILKTAQNQKPDLVFIGPEAPLAVGVVDTLTKNGVPCVGPTKKLAQIETSKIFAREFMVMSGLSEFCPKFCKFYPGQKEYQDYIPTIGEHVIKADGLCGGKGVKVWGDHLNSLEESFEFCTSLHKSGSPFLVEEKLVGQEFSFISFTDGKTVKHTIPVKDYKRAYDGDVGPNTGSMGSTTGNLTFLTDNDIVVCQKINEKVVHSLSDYFGELYKGILYGSFMKVGESIKIIEFNCRFGDPECVNILASLKTDLCAILKSIIDQTLHQVELEFTDQYTVFKYLVPNGYPNTPVKGKEVYINPTVDQSKLIYASCERNGNRFYELGSRTIGAVGTGSTLKEAYHDVESQLALISGPLFYRKDIGKPSITYQESGVNIEEGNKVIREIEKHVVSTFNGSVISKFGDFAGMIKVGNNTLVSSTDGVGTKSILVLETFGPELGYEMLGHDIVNHCVNDILVKGAKPLFFMDYFASSTIDSQHVKHFVKGVSQACKDVGCVLLGGETAEMPDVYCDGKSDIVGTIVGLIEEGCLIDGQANIKEGDRIVAIPSSGPHTNGYSLIRKILKSMDDVDPTFVQKLCMPHRCYFHDVQKIRQHGVQINGLCHITGGGLIDNPERVLPEGLSIRWTNHTLPPLFQRLKEEGNLSSDEMRRVFNCGYGLIVVFPEQDYYKLKQIDDLDWFDAGFVIKNKDNQIYQESRS